ncbi:MAG: tetratricopeptide repeat protein [Rhodospirillales bacterium]|nr:tetratricopeptide repeat protein [Rhodospirillales bacterium]
MNPARTSRKQLKSISLIADEDVDLATAALNIAVLDRSGVTPEPYLRHLDKLAQDVGLYAGPEPDADQALEALVQIISRRYGYGGNEGVFGELESANLCHVIDNRCGLPVVIGIIYIQCARAQGWSATGIDFPGRFLIRLEINGERRIFDAFDGGAVLQPFELRTMLKAAIGNDAELLQEHYADLDNRGVLLRLENYCKVRHLKAERFDDALKVIETMLLITPDNATLWREAGMIHVHLDRVPQAIEALEEYLRLDTSSSNRYRATALLQELRNKINT